ncbi:MAG: 3-isopropylmalate dehydrogenase [Planctomycetota bacterium]
MYNKKIKILLLPGDGIGKEVVPEARKILEVISSAGRFKIIFEHGLIGGDSIDSIGEPITDQVIRKAKSSDAVLLGAVGGPKWDILPYDIRPEQGLLRLRKELKVFANLRPVEILMPLIDASPIKREIVEGTDFIIVRELTGGIYFGKPRGIKKTIKGEKGINTEVYYQWEIERIAHTAFDIARKRRKKVTSVDKANVLESSSLWRQVVTQVHRKYPDVKLDHLYVDNCAMQIIKNPKQFDVILTSNMFGDILSDEAAALVGSIGMLASASLSDKVAIYEPIHGSAPDIAGQNRGNPLATICSVALMFRYSFGNEEIAASIEKAVKNVLVAGHRTADIAMGRKTAVTTSEIGDLVREELRNIIV